MVEQLPDLDIRKYAYSIPDPLIVFERFSNSELGEDLHGRTRFHVFQNRVLNEKWIENAGPDTDNLLHMMETYKLTEAFLNSNREFSKKEKELLLFTAIVHDMGEVVDGDISRPDKKLEHHEEEMRMLSGILEQVLREDMGEFERYNLIGDVVDILNEKDSKLGKAFNAIEIVGYSVTALNCWRGYRMFEENNQEQSLIEGFRSLAHAVVINDISELVRYSSEYEYVYLYLIQNKNYISDIIKDADFEGECDSQKLLKAKSAWENFNSLCS